MQSWDDDRRRHLWELESSSLTVDFMADHLPSSITLKGRVTALRAVHPAHWCSALFTTSNVHVGGGPWFVSGRRRVSSLALKSHPSAISRRMGSERQQCFFAYLLFRGLSREHTECGSRDRRRRLGHPSSRCIFLNRSIA